MTEVIYCAQCGARITPRPGSEGRLRFGATGFYLEDSNEGTKVCGVRCAERWDGLHHVHRGGVPAGSGWWARSGAVR